MRLVKTSTTNDPDFGHERDAEAALVVVAGGDALLDARHWVVELARPAAARAHVQDGRQHLSIQAQSAKTTLTLTSQTSRLILHNNIDIRMAQR